MGAFQSSMFFFAIDHFDWPFTIIFVNIPQVKGLYYQYDIVELLPFNPPIYNIRTHF